MTKMMCGVDVGSSTLDARIGRDGAWQQLAGTVDGINDLAAFCSVYQVELVVMEATGGYERMPFGQLCGLGLPVAIINPRGMRRFAEAMGCLEKTDRIDCGTIAWYAQSKRIQPTPPASATQARLSALVVRLRQLTELGVAQINQRRLVSEPDAWASFEPILAAVAQQSRALAAMIAAAIDADPLWAALAARFRTIKGLAGRTVAPLMAERPEIGTLSNKAIAKLAGLAPIARDSGKMAGRRPVRAGREGVRSILFVVAEIVRRHQPDFADFHARLGAARKPKMLIRIAQARKRLVRLTAKARNVRNDLAQAT